MNVSYKKLWKLLIDRSLNRTTLQRAAQISTRSIAKLGRNENVNTDTLVKVCKVLECDVGDIMEIIPDGVPIPPIDDVTNPLKPILRSKRESCGQQLEQLPLFPNMDSDLSPEVPKQHFSTQFTFIDLFAGIGGIRLGFEDAGGKCVFSSEWDKDAAKTYEANFGEKPFGDITKISPNEIPDFDILLGGFPCQPFSIIGAKAGFQHETQGTLFFNIEEILKAKKPKAFMLENVKNLTAHDGGRTFKIILGHLKNAGYHVHYKVLNALDFGVPQKRERIIIVGFRNDIAFEFPAPLPASKRAHIKDILEPEEIISPKLYVKAAIRDSRLSRLKEPDFPKPYISHENVAGDITPHSYSCALRAGASANYLLINDERRPSEREMLRIQGFPDSFKIVVPYGKIRHQTGNSVAVPVIKAVAQKMISAMISAGEL